MNKSEQRIGAQVLVSAMQKGHCAIVNEILLFAFGDVVLNLEIEFEQFSAEPLTFLLTE